MKSYTDLKQSKKLAEILPHESADMVHFGIHLGMDGKYYLSGTNNEDDVVPIYKNLCTKVFVNVTASDITCQLPCWSLAALLNILNTIKGWYPGIDAQVGEEHNWQICMFSYETGSDISTAAANKELVDTCYEVILKLHKLNLL